MWRKRWQPSGASALGLEAIGIHDNFFDLGGHSLKATQVVSRVSQRLDADVPLRELFNRPTIIELAAEIESAGARTHGPIARVPDADDYPLSHAQRRLWVLCRTRPRAAYNMPAALLLDGPVDRDRFERGAPTSCDGTSLCARRSR